MTEEDAKELIFLTRLKLIVCLGFCLMCTWTFLSTQRVVGFCSVLCPEN